jgi:hypothetical protein
MPLVCSPTANLCKLRQHHHNLDFTSIKYDLTPAAISSAAVNLMTVSLINAMQQARVAQKDIVAANGKPL